jgi:phosphopantetheine--protein transferase-like protein
MFIGNDIVAYKHVRCLNKWQQERFLEKILRPEEIKQLHVQHNKDAFLWSLWTLKEAAYKLSCFLGNRNKFHAKQFTVRHLSLINNEMVQHIDLPGTNVNNPAVHNYHTTVQYEDKLFFGKTLIAYQFVHSLVTDEASLQNDLWAIGIHNNYNKDDYSAEVRSFAKQEMNEQLVFFNAIEKDKDGIPYVVTDASAQYISLSHDQQFVSFAYHNM